MMIPSCVIEPSGNGQHGELSSWSQSSQWMNVLPLSIACCQTVAGASSIIWPVSLLLERPVKLVKLHYWPLCFVAVCAAQAVESTRGMQFFFNHVAHLEVAALLN